MILARASDPYEICRILSELNFDGQRILVTPDSFAKPNIQLVCKILDWFLKILKLSAAFSRLEPDKRGHDDSKASNLVANVGPTSLSLQERPAERPPNGTGPQLRASDCVEFLLHFGLICYELLGVKLDLVALCRADTACCPELLKVARPIFEAAKLSVEEGPKRLSKSGGELDWFRRELETKRKCCEELFTYASQDNSIDQLSSRCAGLSEELQSLLKNEEQHQEERLKVIERRLEIVDIERVLSDSLDGIKQETEQLKRTNAELEHDLLRLDEKLAAKENEIGEARGKLSELLVKSPAYASQYEALKKRYEIAYGRYVSSYRNLAHLKLCATTTAVVNDSLDDDLDEEDCLCADDGKFYRDWLVKHSIGIGIALDSVPNNSNTIGSSHSLVPYGAGHPPKRPLTKDITVGASLLVFDDDENGGSRSGTADSSRLVESLLNAGTPDPMTTASSKDIDSVGEKGSRIGGGGDPLAGDGAYASRGLAVSGDVADPGLELEGLLDEFAPHDPTQPTGRATGGTEDSEVFDDEDDDDEEEDDDEENEDDDDLIR